MVMSFKAGNHLRFAEALLAISISANAFTAEAQVAPNVASASGSASATPNLNLCDKLPVTGQIDDPTLNALRIS